MKTKLFFICLIFSFATNVFGDETTCMSDYESSEGLHYVCFCDPPNQDVSVAAKEIDKDQGFSLSDFAFNLAGSYFSKAIFITFQSCRNLRIKLDQSELSRIGSDHFRPDIQVRALSVEQVYHLELLREVPKKEEEYVIAFPSEEMEISLQSVALVKLDAGAQFTSLKTSTKYSRLYIDLNEGNRGDEDGLNIQGFKTNNIFFITDRQKIRLEEGEDLGVKMRQLSTEMMSQTQELSFALTIFAVVILVGIIGLAGVVAHRQKKKRQLKSLLRTKNLGTILDSKEIAQGISKKYNLDDRLPRYTQVRKPSISSIVAIDSEISSPNNNEAEKTNGLPNNNNNKRVDINEFMSAILYRTRKGQYRTGMNGQSPPPIRNIDKPLPETSFYYKESSLSEASGTYHPVVGVVEADVHHHDEEDNGSYVSKISQQVFIAVDQAPKANLRDQFLTFFSSVSKSSGVVKKSSSVVKKDDDDQLQHRTKL